MNAYSIAFDTAMLLFIALFAFAGTFLCIFLERMLSARIQHRDGPGIGGQIDYFQVWKDFQKVRRRSGSRPASGRKPLLLLWSALPLVFLFVLLGGILPAAFRDAGLWILIFILLLSISLEALLLHASGSDRERLDWRSPLLLKVLGVSALTVASTALTMRVGDSDLRSLSSFQAYLPFHAMLASPGLFFLSLVAFVSIYLIIGNAPIGTSEEKSLSGGSHYLIFYVSRMWSFSLIVFWVYLFCGGVGGIIPKMLLPVKSALFVFIYVLFQISVPHVRTSDASALALRWILTFGFVGFALEVLWMGFFL